MDGRRWGWRRRAEEGLRCRLTELVRVLDRVGPEPPQELHRRRRRLLPTIRSHSPAGRIRRHAKPSADQLQPPAGGRRLGLLGAKHLEDRVALRGEGGWVEGHGRHVQATGNYGTAGAAAERPGRPDWDKAACQGRGAWCFLCCWPDALLTPC